MTEETFEEKLDFEEKLEKLGMIPYKIEFNVTGDVYRELHRLARENNYSFDNFMREVIDFFLLNDGRE